MVAVPNPNLVDTCGASAPRGAPSCAGTACASAQAGDGRARRWRLATRRAAHRRARLVLLRGVLAVLLGMAQREARRARAHLQPLAAPPVAAPPTAVLAFKERANTGAPSAARTRDHMRTSKRAAHACARGTQLAVCTLLLLLLAALALHTTALDAAHLDNSSCAATTWAFELTATCAAAGRAEPSASSPPGLGAAYARQTTALAIPAPASATLRLSPSASPRASAGVLGSPVTVATSTVIHAPIGTHRRPHCSAPSPPPSPSAAAAATASALPFALPSTRPIGSKTDGEKEDDGAFHLADFDGDGEDGDEC